MFVVVEFSSAWSHALDKGHNVTRSFPQHWRGELELEIAAAAIVAGVATASGPHTEELEAAIAALRAPPPAPSADHKAFVGAIRAEAVAIATATDEEILQAYKPPADPQPTAPAPAPAAKPIAPRAPRAPRKGKA